MELGVYSVLDVKGAEFGPVYLSANDRLAERSLLESMRGASSLLSRYPEDFLLYRIGGFDSTTGALKPLERPQIVVGVRDLLNKVEGAAHA